MSKDGNPDTSEFDPLNREFIEEEKQQQEKQKQEQELFSQPPPIEQEADDGVIVTSVSSTQSTPSISTLSGSISPDGQTVDPITKAVRETIIQPQKDDIIEQILKDLTVLEDHDLAEQKRKEIEEEKEKDKTLSAFFGNPVNREFIDKALENPELKKKLEQIELAGYKNVHETFSADKYPGGFKPMQWNDSAGGDNTRAQIVKNDAGDELCTLNEKTHKTKPFTVAKQDGTQVQVSSYREVDFPIKLDKADGSMHLSMVALKADGTKPSKDKAVYFTAHYEEGPNGKPLLKEISSPKPLKFAGDGPDAVAYIEHGGEIYTLAVTRGKYQEMMKEVAVNKGQAVDLSQSEDLIIGHGQSRVQETNEPVITQNQELKSSIETPTATQMQPITPDNQPLQPETSQVQPPQPQQAQSSGILNPVLNAATNLSQDMQDLLNQLNTDLKSEVEKTDLIKHVAAKILQNKETGFDEKQAGINALTENTINNKDLTPEVKVEGVGSILESIKGDNALSDPEKSKMLEGTVAIVLNAENLDPKYKQQIVEKATGLALAFDDEVARGTALNGLSDTIINSNLPNEQKGSMLIGMGNKINESKLTPKEKSQLIGDILEKGKEAGVLTLEQQQLMQQNLDKITAEQTKNAEIAEVQGILANPAFNAIAKTEAIQNVTTKVLDSPVKAEIKGETLEGITKVVAESPLDGQDKANIVKGVGETIASHKTIAPTEKIAAIESIEKGVAESTADLEDKKLMTKGLVDGIYNGKAGPEITSEMTTAVSNGIDKSTASPEEKNTLKEAASGAVLERETQNLNKDLSQSVEQTKPQHDIYGAAKGVTDALKGVLDSAEEGFKHSKESVVLAEEEVVKKTSGILNDISSYVERIKNTFRDPLDVAKEKKAESEQQINNSVAEYKIIDDKYKPQHEQQQGSYDNTKELEEKKLFVENLKLDDKEKIKLISTLIQNEAENKKKGAVNNIAMLTENRTKLEEKVATQDKSKVGYDAQLKPRKDTGRGPS